MPTIRRSNPTARLIVQVEPLLGQVLRRVATERGVTMSAIHIEALERELGPELRAARAARVTK